MIKNKMNVGDCNVIDRWGFFRIDKLEKLFSGNPFHGRKFIISNKSSLCIPVKRSTVRCMMCGSKFGHNASNNEYN